MILAVDFDPVLFPACDGGRMAGVVRYSSSSPTRRRGSSEGLPCSTGSGIKPIIAFNSAGVTDFLPRPRPETDRRGVLAIFVLTDVRGGEALRVEPVDFRLLGWGAVAGASLARGALEETDCDRGWAEGVLIGARLFLGLLAFGVADGEVDLRGARPSTISTRSLGCRVGAELSVGVAMSNGD